MENDVWRWEMKLSTLKGEAQEPGQKAGPVQGTPGDSPALPVLLSHNLAALTTWGLQPPREKAGGACASNSSASSSGSTTSSEESQGSLFVFSISSWQVRHNNT